MPADRTAEERAREIAERVVEAYDKEWASKPITGHPFRPVDKHALKLGIAAEVATAIASAVEAEREANALIADAAARSLDGDESVYIREVAASNAETLVKIVRDDARQDHLSAATGLILHATVRARQVAGDRAAAAIRAPKGGAAG